MLEYSTIGCQKLQDFLNNVKGNIPIKNKYHRTTFDIMGQPHLENVWSNIYAFFFNPQEEHLLGNLFVTSLVELINESNSVNFSPFCEQNISIKKEDSTEDKKRIDIALSSSDYAIMIENKVNASLYNDLDKYWSNYRQEHKQGVVLSCHSISIDTKYQDTNSIIKKWINITHLDLLERVNKNLPNYLLDCNNKYLLFYKEFYLNVNKTTNIMNTESLDFYLKNAEDIEKISCLRNDIKNDIKEQIKRRIESFSDFGLDTYNENSNGKCIHVTKKGDRSLMYTIGYWNLFSEKKSLSVVIEVQNDFLRKCKEQMDEIDFNEEENNVIKKPNPSSKDSWFHIASKTKMELTAVDFQNISKVVEELIFKSPLQSIFKKLEDFKKK